MTVCSVSVKNHWNFGQLSGAILWVGLYLRCYIDTSNLQDKQVCFMKTGLNVVILEQ